MVKGTRFLCLREAGNPVAMGEAYSREGVDELVFLDISASAEGRAIMLDVVKRTASRVFIPFTVGGGIRTVEQIREILHAGADKVSLNTAAIEQPELLSWAADRFGSQCVVLAIDAKRNGGSWEVYSYGGRKATGMDAVEWAVKGQEMGAGEILLTSIDADGTRGGYDLELIRAVSESVRVPVIASGGAGHPQHLVDAVRAGASGVLVASMLHYGMYSVREIKEYLCASGVRVR